MMSRILILVFLFGFVLMAKAEDRKFIKPNNQLIEFKGALFIQKSDQKVIISRHSKSMLEHPQTFMVAKKANTQSGVTICFSCNSSKIDVAFEKRNDADSRQNVFGVYKNGEFYKSINGLTFTIDNQEKKESNNWEIVLPTFSGVNFLGLKIDNKAKLFPVKKETKPVYVAIGNSITHGVGQKGAAYLSYPFLLAREKNWELYNLAVGGSKISWPVAQLLKDIKVDVITVLWGYNDWNSTFLIESEIKPYYKKLLLELRKVQPKAKIYCILPTTSKSLTPKNGSDSLDDIRDTEREIINKLQAKGDKNLFLIEGHKMTTVDDLNDAVHLSVDGAANFTKHLLKEINSSK